jgi:hypothetical protein
MKIRLNRAPYICPVLNDHLGSGAGHYQFGTSWLNVPVDFQKEKEDDMFWTGKIITRYENTDGWLQVELYKECFDIVEE